MSSANISAGPASCMKFNSSFLYYVGFFILLVIGYMWGKRNGTKEERRRDAKEDARKVVAVKGVSSEETPEEKPKAKMGKTAVAVGAAAVGGAALVASKAKKAGSKARKGKK